MTSLTQHEALQPYAAQVLSGQSPAVERLRLQIARIAPHFRVALLVGEAGSGKQTVARELHRLSPVAERPFRTLHAAECGLDQTAAGTIYLQGLETLAMADQPRLLRNLKSLHRTQRLIVGTKGDPKGLLATGRLRHDLHQTVATFEIRVPALRERMEDLGPIMHILAPNLVDARALSILREHRWPGNLEELHRLCRDFERNRQPITAANLCSLNQVQAPISPRLHDVMQRHVREVLESCAGNKLRAAELLGISRSTLYRMLGAAAA